MASFPILQIVEINGYGMYPGINHNGTFKVAFAPGLTLILGANGLGKSTLISILFRSLTGPYDISLPAGSIGTAELRAAPLNRHLRLGFGARVHDAAVNATVSLTFLLGQRRIQVSRSLEDLTLKGLRVDDSERAATEEAFQQEIIDASHIATFGEWILVLRTLVFFFEDRRSLVWDASAQRQLLRCLLLTPERARQWAEQEREILELDTRMRNLQSAVRREQKETADTQRRIQAAPGVTAALRAAEASSERLKEEQVQLAESLADKDQARHRHRLDALRAQSEHDQALQELERARLSAVESRFPSADESMRYIVARLMSDGECLVCGTKERKTARDRLIAAIDQHRCVICDAPVKTRENSVVDLSVERITGMRERVESTAITSATSKKLLDDSARAYDVAIDGLRKCADSLAEIHEQIQSLVSQLPPEEQAARRQYDDLKGLENRVATMRQTLKEKREAFAEEMNGHREAIRHFAADIKTSFEAAASGFLLEHSGLSWSPVRTPVGQAGGDGAEPVDYPAFAVELSGSDFSTIVRRDGPGDVSESQREFIDLAFRMALIHVAAENKAGTIVIDAPESSLDAVFINRAAAVLAHFANANPFNRLIAASNLAGSELVPAMLIAADADAERRKSRLVDLFTTGNPTQAMKQLASEYASHRAALYRKIAGTGA
jgi:AAA domain